MAGVTGAGKFSAADSTLGYLYQVRLALLWALRRLKSESDFLVSVETLDDVAFETADGDIAELLQTKHHRKGIADLTDSSVDLWKTFRIWFEGHASGRIPPTAKLYLITTATAPNGTAASLLRASPRNVAAAQQALDAAASSSTNKVNLSAYTAYLGATPSGRGAILEKVVVIDASPTITDLDSELRQEVFWAVGKEHHVPFLERLEGWWMRRVRLQLTTATGDRIASSELEAQMSDLREQFKQDALPVDDDLLDFTLDPETKAAYEGYSFVLQLEIIKAGKRRIAAAIRDYYRAFEQRSRWLRDDLVVGLDLHKYEKRLCEEWELVFEAMRDNLGDVAADEAKEHAARSVLAWAERAAIPIRLNVTEPFVCRGSLHMLADEAKIGWHPEFSDRLTAILTAKGATK
ncbi:MAG: hypothetical protein A2X35_11630 [Elusimicrobia bacterium GWA2_61_42]|nr:MAG: hypothetical protein A2X35_11630 [Elusimicrobia bacterium GWA2_61_42]OGR75814.1 MAG: hypothetical protein A2X38_07285 [Elusimicrobia bacterium GWC2_61_25]